MFLRVHGLVTGVESGGFFLGLVEGLELVVGFADLDLRFHQRRFIRVVLLKSSGVSWLIRYIIRMQFHLTCLLHSGWAEAIIREALHFEARLAPVLFICGG